MTNTIVPIPLFRTKAKYNVANIETKKTDDACLLVLSNMVLHCRPAPTKNPVLPIDIKLPTVYGIANFEGFITIMGTYIVLMPLDIPPKTKNNINPKTRCLYVSSIHGHGFSVVVAAASAISPPPNGILAQVLSEDPALFAGASVPAPLTFRTKFDAPEKIP
jgi:hypothetical protein